MILMQGKGVSKGVIKGPLYSFQRQDTTVVKTQAADTAAAKIAGELRAEALISISHLLLTKHVNLAFRIVPGGTHCEASWEKQIPIFMDCLGI